MMVIGIYSNSYHFYDYADMLGIQVYMRSNTFPDIDILGATPDTVYQTSPDITIDVTDGSISSFKTSRTGIYKTVPSSLQ